jgi:hypothetical protein
MRGFVFLCDYAEEIGGKLYIMGGGWTRLMRVGPLLDMSVAGKLFIPWVEANRPHTLRVASMTGDGEPVLAADQRPVQLAGKLEVGRPAGLPEGTELDLPLAVRFEDLALDAGRCRWELHVDDNHVADATFDVASPQR